MKILEKFENCFSILNRTWDIFHAIYCENVDLAKRFEQLIKNMKSLINFNTFHLRATIFCSSD